MLRLKRKKFNVIQFEVVVNGFKINGPDQTYSFLMGIFWQHSELYVCNHPGISIDMCVCGVGVCIVIKSYVLR